MARAAIRFRSLGGLAILVAATLLLAGCDLGSSSGPPPATCAAAGMQCQLPDGPLGVCERTQCAPGHSEPCFQCVSQH